MPDFYVHRIKKLCKVSTRLRKSNIGYNHNIAIVKYDGLGDFVLFLDFASHLKDMYREKRVTLFCDANVAFLAQQSGFFDEIIIVNLGDLTSSVVEKTYKNVISQKKFDILLNPTRSRSFESDFLSRLINAKTKISATYECGFVPTYQHLLGVVYDMEIETNKDSMMLIQNAEFARGLGFSNFKATLPILKYLPKQVISLVPQYYVLFIGGSFFSKLWGNSNWKEIVKYINSKTKLIGIICGIDDDTRYAQELICSCDNMIDMTGKTDINELLTIINKAAFVIGNDTSAIHFAAALNVQAIAIAGQFAATRFYPYVLEEEPEHFLPPIFVATEMECSGCSFHYQKMFQCMRLPANKKIDCIHRIKVQDVIDALDKVLSEYYEKNQKENI